MSRFRSPAARVRTSVAAVVAAAVATGGLATVPAAAATPAAASGAATAATSAAPAPAAAALAEPTYDVLVFSKTAGVPSRLDPRGHRARSSRSARRTASPSTRPRTRRSSPTPTSPSTTSSSGCPRPATCSTPPSRPRSSATSRPAAATSASTPPPTPSTRGPGTARCSAPTSATTRPARRPRRSRSRTPTSPPRPRFRPPGTRADEWYNFQKPTDPVVATRRASRTTPPRTSDVHVLATLDESTYDEVDGNATDDDHPISWCSNFDGGRSLVHRPRPHPGDLLRAATSLKHLLGGLKTAAGAVARPPATPPAPTSNDFEQVDARQGRRQDRRADVAGRAARPPRPAHRARRPHLAHRRRRHHHAAATTHVYSHDEDGLQGVAVDPDFATTAGSTSTTRRRSTPRPATPRPTAPRPQFAPWQGLQPAVPVQAGRRRHARPRERAGDPAGRRPTAASAATSAATSTSTPHGNLYLSTGDDTNPFASDGYAPIDERADRNPAFDAQRTVGQHQRPARQAAADQGPTPPTARTRSRPATCSRPAPGKTRPEIYAMGFRNPFRMTVDKRHRLRLPRRLRPRRRRRQPQPRPRRPGRVQPDHASPATTAGRTAPAPTTRRLQRVELRDQHRRREVRLRRRRRTTRPHNTGLTDLPPAQAGLDRVRRRQRHLQRHHRREFGGGGESPMGGPVYHFDAATSSRTRSSPSTSTASSSPASSDARLDQATSRWTPTAA